MPYVFETLPERGVKHREESIPPVRELRPDVSERLEAAVMHSLARNPDYRPESAAAFAEELAAASPEPPTRPCRSPPGSTRPTLLPRRRRSRRRSSNPGASHECPGVGAGPGFWAAIAIVVVIGLLIGYAVATRGGDFTPASQGREQVEPVPEAPDFAGKARNLAEWLRENSG